MTLSARTIAGTSLVEASLALALLAAMLACLLPLSNAIENRKADLQLESNMADWMSHVEGFAITRRRLPCPAQSSDGVEQSADMTGTCLLSTGYLPWLSVGLRQPSPTPRYAVATLETLGSPYSQLLTRQDGFKSVPIDLLSAAIFAAPDPAGTSPGTLPALLIRPSRASSATQDTTTLNGMPCSGTLFLTVSAVAIISSDPALVNDYTNGNRCFSTPAPGHQRRMQWLSYERLFWLYLRAGTLSSF